MKYIVWTKNKYSNRWEMEEFSTLAEVVNACMRGAFEGNSIITRRMTISVTDAEEIEPPAEVPVSIAPPVEVPVVTFTKGEDPF